MSEARLERGLDYLENRQVELITFTPEMFLEGRLFSSQPATSDWVKEWKVQKPMTIIKALTGIAPNILMYSPSNIMTRSVCSSVMAITVCLVQ